MASLSSDEKKELEVKERLLSGKLWVPRVPELLYHCRDYRMQGNSLRNPNYARIKWSCDRCANFVEADTEGYLGIIIKRPSAHDFEKPEKILHLTVKFEKRTFVNPRKKSIGRLSINNHLDRWCVGFFPIIMPPERESEEYKMMPYAAPFHQHAFIRYIEETPNTAHWKRLQRSIVSYLFREFDDFMHFPAAALPRRSKIFVSEVEFLNKEIIPEAQVAVLRREAWRVFVQRYRDALTERPNYLRRSFVNESFTPTFQREELEEDATRRERLGAPSVV